MPDTISLLDTPPPSTIRQNVDYVNAYVAQPAQWQYDVDQANGLSRASYIGEVFIGGTAAGNQAATKADIAAATTGVSTWNGRSGAVTLTLADVTGAGGAPIASPTFTGAPAVPTAPPGTATTQAASTGFVTAAIGTLQGATVASFNGRVGAVNLTTGDVTGAGGAPAASPTLTGTPMAPTASQGTATGQIATTQFVANAIAGGAVATWNGRQGNVSLQLSDITSVGGAPIASPTFTGIPAVPTAAPGTATTQAASTAFVTSAITGATTGVSSFNTRTGAITLTAADVVAAGGAPIVSPALTGTPSAPTATAGTSTTQLATTAFVANAISTLPGVSSFNGRQGTVTLQLADVTSVGGAPVASPTFSGTPIAPTPTPGDNSTRIATTAFMVALNASYAPLASPALTGTPTVPTATAGTATTQAASTAFVQAAIAPAFNDVGRNLIHNPLFSVAQRGAGPWTVNGYTFDRWFSAFSGSSQTITRVPQNDSGRAAIGDEASTIIAVVTVTGTAGAADYAQILQPIENVQRLSGKTVTISFWAAGGTAGLKIGVSIDQIFGTGGSPSASVSGNGQAVTLTTGWARYFITANVPSTAGKTLGTNGDDRTQIDFWVSSGANNNVRAGNIGVQSGIINLWGVQLEIGTQATALDYGGSPQQQLAQCQRFYQVGNVGYYGTSSGSGNGFGYRVLFPVAMRGTPTIAFNSPSYIGASGLTAIGISSGQFLANATSSVAASGPVSFDSVFTASADL